MTTARVAGLSRAQRRRRLSLATLRATASAAILVALYYLLPLDRMTHLPLWLSLLAGLIALTIVAFYQVRGVTRSRHPALRAVEALATTAPLFLLLFAAAYFIMANAEPNSFTAGALSRTDSLYFTVTVFATVGFGDITAVTQTARVVTMIQMLLDLIVLGLLIRLVLSAVQTSQQKRAASRAEHSQAVQIDDPEKGPRGE